MEMGTEEKADISSLLEVNRLDYRLPPSLSIATSRAMKVYRSHVQNYVTGQDQMQFTLSSGATYVDFLNSYLRFQVRVPPQDAGVSPKIPAHCGWANMIRQVRIIHSSGVEIDRFKDSVGEWIQIKNYYDRSEAQRKTQGSLYGLNDTARASLPSGVTNEMLERAKQGLNIPAGGAAGAVQGDTLASKATEVFFQDYKIETTSTKTVEFVYDVAIPLSHVCSFFDVDLLAPSFLCAGLQVYIDFYPPSHFFVCGTDKTGVGKTTATAGTFVGNVTLTQAEMHLETFTLTDSIVRKLSQISASSGLEWYFDSVHQASIVTGSDSLSMQITRALSRANNVVVKTRNDKWLGNSLLDSYASQAWVIPDEENNINNPNTLDTTGRKLLDKDLDGSMEEFQVQLGAQYIPSRSITGRKEMMHSAYKTFSQFRRSDEQGEPNSFYPGGVHVWRCHLRSSTGEQLNFAAEWRCYLCTAYSCCEHEVEIPLLLRCAKQIRITQGRCFCGLLEAGDALPRHRCGSFLKRDQPMLLLINTKYFSLQSL
jgi:hypothetical protein